MKSYSVEPEMRGSKWKVHSWNVRQEGFFGARKLANFMDRQQAIEYVRALGDKNRPSRVRTFDFKGREIYSWSYGERPRVRK